MQGGEYIQSVKSVYMQGGESINIFIIEYAEWIILLQCYH